MSGGSCNPVLERFGDHSEPPKEQVEPPVKLTLSKAAKHLGKSKGTLSRALNSGEMSGTKADDGSWQIDQSELMRWVSTTRSRERVEDRSEPPETPPEPPAIAAGWEAQMALMRERLDDATATVADLRERLDASEAERRALNQRLLAAPAPSEPPASQEAPGGAEKPQERRRGIFGWFARSRR